jgi:hypothetical protein
MLRQRHPSFTVFAPPNSRGHESYGFDLGFAPDGFAALTVESASPDSAAGESTSGFFISLRKIFID